MVFIFLAYFTLYISFICSFICIYLAASGSFIEAYWLLSSCGTWAQLPRGMWDLSSLTRDRTHISCPGRWMFNHWTTREVPSSIVSFVARSVARAADPPTPFP